MQNLNTIFFFLVKSVFLNKPSSKFTKKGLILSSFPFKFTNLFFFGLLYTNFDKKKFSVPVKRHLVDQIICLKYYIYIKIKFGF